MPPSPKKRRVDVNFTLKRVFRKTSFRPLQLEVINAAIAGNDIFLCAATSFGKSLCFQLPAVVSTGVTVVISPLLALMTNQVDAALKLGIPTKSIHGNTPRSERQKIETDLLCGHPETRLLYVTPELCAYDNFRRILSQIHRQGQLTRIAIDEAHCISEWGHDFRTAYKDLMWLKQHLQCPSVPIMAVTATATTQVRADIFTYLQLKNVKVFTTSSARPNIHYEIQYFNESEPANGEDDMFPYLVNWLTRMHQRRVLAKVADPIHGIIYCPTRVMADALSDKLTDAGIRAASYHAGLDPYKRISVQAAFLETKPATDAEPEDIAASFNLICATTAFGMGIDMPTIRFVVHYGLPRGMESFIQESGRAGRDNKAAASVILYSREERDRCIWRGQRDASKEKNKILAKSRQLSMEKMIGFCENTSQCRHKLVSQYFGEDASAAVCNYACDVCKEGAVTLQKRKDKCLATFEAASQFTQREGMGGYEYD
jgi:RecQ family ATP-dependent DNA helicase